MTLSTTELLLLSWLSGPVHDRLARLTVLCSERVPYREISRQLGELDDLVCGMTEAMQEAVGS